MPALGFVGRVMGQSEAVARLVGDFRIDDSKVRRMLPFKTEAGIDFDMARMTRSFMLAAEEERRIVPSRRQGGN